MFILIASIDRFRPREPFDWQSRRELAIRKYFEKREKENTDFEYDDGDGGNGDIGGIHVLGDKRLSALTEYIVKMHSKRQNLFVNNSCFQELFIEQEGDTLHVHVFGSKYVPCPPLGEYDAMEKLHEEFRTLNAAIKAKEIKAKNIICYFDRVTYMNSEGLGTLVLLNKTIKKQGGRLELNGVKPQLAEVLEVTKLNELFEIIKLTPNSYKEIEVEQIDNNWVDKGHVTIRLLSRNYDSNRLRILNRELMSLLGSQYDTRFITLDFEGVNSVDPSMINILKKLQTILEKRFGGMLVISLSEQLRNSDFERQVTELKEDASEVVCVL